ncbi:GtrA family protein [Leucobacter sp. NPDC058333]|uniref:GtrA family protein n=1 Tax=Leucobacter sp. NPDC058333 TaxID=3346450 RepID=UPI00365045F4
MIILIPAYEPSTRLVSLVRELRCADTGEPPADIWVIDDGSGPAFDRVFEDVAEVGAQVTRFDTNRGKGATLKAGFAAAQREQPGSPVVTADADGQHTVADILRVVEGTARSVANTGETAPLLLGCRGFDGDVPVRSRFGNAVSRWLFRAVAGWPLSDTQTGLRGVPAAMLPWLAEVPGERFEYEQIVLLRLRGAGFTAREIPIDTVYLDDNGSSHFRPVLDSLRVMLPVLLFALSSLSAFVIDTIALVILQALTGALVPSIIAARVLSAGMNFAVNRRLVFARTGGAELRRQVVQYVGLAAVLLASNIVWMSFLTEHGVPLWLAKVVTEGVLFILSYRVQRAAIFRAPSAEVSARSIAKPRQHAV